MLRPHHIRVTHSSLKFINHLSRNLYPPIVKNVSIMSPSSFSLTNLTASCSRSPSGTMGGECPDPLALPVKQDAAVDMTNTVVAEGNTAIQPQSVKAEASPPAEEATTVTETPRRVLCLTSCASFSAARKPAPSFPLCERMIRRLNASSQLPPHQLRCTTAAARISTVPCLAGR